MPSAPRVVVYPGSFDPITLGHLDVIERARGLFDEVVVAVGRNPGKQQLFTPEERVAMTQALAEKMQDESPSETRVTVHSFEGLTVDFAQSVNATAIIRGIRNLSDLQYEVQQAVTNRQVAGLETVFIVAGQSFAYTSSSLIKQITAMGSDLSVLSSMCPPEVIEMLRHKQQEDSPLLQSLRTIS
ncbi:MAG: pantetheine-phosphate adenylyltransferase [Planctomycetota bacterium]|jgi:pantetheine-phosphate adenylyltransferase